MGSFAAAVFYLILMCFLLGEDLVRLLDAGLLGMLLLGSAILCLPYMESGKSYRQMKEILPRFGVEVTELPRKEQGGAAVSASRVRALLAEDKLEEIQPLVPETTWAFLQSSEGRSVAQRVRQSR